MAKVFVFTGHPSADSLSASLADAYAEGAASAGAQVRKQNVCNMSFDPDLTNGYKKRKTLEPCLRKWRDNLSWSSHIAFFFPTWWGSLPAKTKGVMDRALLPGYGFRMDEGATFQTKLLTGRTAHVTVTADTPGWFDRLIFSRATKINITKQIFGFCGIRTTKYRHVAVVKSASEEEIQKWVARARADGAKAAKKLLSETAIESST